MRSSHRSVFHGCSTLHASAAVNRDTFDDGRSGGAIEECGYQKVARGITRLLRRTRTSAYLESAFGALASPPSGEMRLPNVREGEGSPEDLGGTLAPDSNPKDGHFRRHRQRCPNAPGRRRRGHLPEPDLGPVIPKSNLSPSGALSRRREPDHRRESRLPGKSAIEVAGWSARSQLRREPCRAAVSTRRPAPRMPCQTGEVSRTLRIGRLHSQRLRQGGTNALHSSRRHLVGGTHCAI